MWLAPLSGGLGGGGGKGRSHRGGREPGGGDPTIGRPLCHPPACCPGGSRGGGSPSSGGERLRAQADVPLLKYKSFVLLIRRDVIVKVNVLLPERSWPAGSLHTGNRYQRERK